MKIKVFYPNEKGHIELTKEKLEGLLNEAYNEGYRDGKNNNGYYYGISTTPYVSSICTDSVYGSTADCISGSVTNAFSNATKDLVSTDTLQVGKISTIDYYDNTAIAANCCAIKVDALEGEAKSDITVEYGEVTNAH